jgi:hypothetical protein
VYWTLREGFMRDRACRLAGLFMLWVLVSCVACGEKPEHRAGAKTEAEAPVYTAADTLNWDTFVTYLQEHFDDFHDVTMRYHHEDATINGIVELHITWENRRLVSADVVSNETGSDDLAASLIEKMRNWEIEGLTGPAEITLPVNVKLVGSDDPDFPNTAILTGVVTDRRGNPLHGAMVMLKPQVGGVVLRAETNREGIFVRTLIPPGTWDLECSHPEHVTVLKQGVHLAAGQHARERFALRKR